MHHVGVPVATLNQTAQLGPEGMLQSKGVNNRRPSSHAVLGLQVPLAAPGKGQAPSNGSTNADGSIDATPPAPKQDTAAKAPNWEVEAKQDEKVVDLAVMKDGESCSRTAARLTGLLLQHTSHVDELCMRKRANKWTQAAACNEALATPMLAYVRRARHAAELGRQNQLQGARRL